MAPSRYVSFNPNVNPNANLFFDPDVNPNLNFSLQSYELFMEYPNNNPIIFKEIKTFFRVMVEVWKERKKGQLSHDSHPPRI